MRRHLYFYTYLDRPYDEAAVPFEGDPGAWLPSPLAPVGDGFVLDLDAGTAVINGYNRREAVVRIHPASSAADQRSTLRGISWKANGNDERFPVFEGDLELAALSADVCQLSIIGSYRPPLSVVGALGDRMVGHRIAEAVVRNFVLVTAERLAGAQVPAV